MGQTRILVHCPDLTKPLGGVRMLYRHVDILNDLGFDASIIQTGKRGSSVLIGKAGMTPFLDRKSRDDLLCLNPLPAA